MSDGEVRFMRDAIYGAGTENNWQACKANWLRADAARWLRVEYNKTITRPPAGPARTAAA